VTWSYRSGRPEFGAGRRVRTARPVRRIHVLVNNAGLVLSERTVTVDGFESTSPSTISVRSSDPAVDRPADGVGPGPGGEVASTLTRGPARTGLRRPPSAGALRGCRRTAGPNWPTPVHAELARRLLVRRDRQRAPSGHGATGFARDDDAKGFLAFGVRLIKPFILTPEKGARTRSILASSGVADSRRVLRQVVEGPSAAARNDRAMLWSARAGQAFQRGSRARWATMAAR